MMPLILASTSPQRQAILHQVGAPFEAIASDYEENNDASIPAHKLVTRHALGKAKNVAQHHPGRVVVGADTLFTLEGKVIGKPRDTAAIIKTISYLSGTSPIVISGFALVRDKKILTGTVESTIHFRTLTDKEVIAYANTGEGLGKAGAFGIQGIGALLLEKVEGDYLNIVGLPISVISQHLTSFGIDLLSNNTLAEPTKPVTT